MLVYSALAVLATVFFGSFINGALLMLWARTVGRHSTATYARSYAVALLAALLFLLQYGAIVAASAGSPLDALRVIARIGMPGAFVAVLALIIVSVTIAGRLIYGIGVLAAARATAVLPLGSALLLGIGFALMPPVPRVPDGSDGDVGAWKPRYRQVAEPKPATGPELTPIDPNAALLLATIGPLFAAIREEAGGPTRILLSGSVVHEGTIASFGAGVQESFPRIEVRNYVRVDKRITETSKQVMRISFAADAVNEAWPRPRFGDVKRLEVIWKDEKLFLRGAVFQTESRTRLEAAYRFLPSRAQGAVQIREVVRAAVAPAVLQSDLSTAIAGRVVAFTPGRSASAPAVDTKDTTTVAVLDAVAPLLRDLRGLEILVSAGAADQDAALQQAEAVKAGLIARGADVAGLRPVPAPANNPFALIVREKE